MMERRIKSFSNKKGDEDLALGPTQLLYLILFILFVLILFAIIYYMKNILK